MEIFDYLFEQYSTYDNIDIVLELIAVAFGITSVVLANFNKVAVYPTGMVSTLIYVYILYKFTLLGDMIINGYYFIISVYGWYFWSTKSKEVNHQIDFATKKEWKITGMIFWGGVLLILTVYLSFGKLTNWISSVDILTTAISFSGMYMMARRRIENWYFWLIGDSISIPLYLYKGLAFSAFQFVVFIVLSISGYRMWKKKIALAKA